MPMPTTNGRLGADITKETALEYIRETRKQYPLLAAEVPAMTLMRHVDSWEEHFAIIAALNAYNRSES